MSILNILKDLNGPDKEAYINEYPENFIRYGHIQYGDNVVIKDKQLHGNIMVVGFKSVSIERCKITGTIEIFSLKNTHIYISDCHIETNNKMKHAIKVTHMGDIPL